MSQQPIAVVGDGNIAGNHLVNVGNRLTVHQNIFTGPRQYKTLAQLELKVAFDALLNSGARYPAPRCHADTRKAAQTVVMNWICGRGDWAEKGIMWISGAPGVGKSAIVQTVCEELDTDDGSKAWLTKFAFRGDGKVDGSYFFGRGLGDREKASFFPATIAFQLCRSRASCRDVIKKSMKRRPGVLSEAFPSQFRQLLTATAKKRWSFQSSITIVIDALDECDSPEDQVELLNLIHEAATTAKIRFLIASRPEHQIQTFFQRSDVSQHMYHIRLDEESFNTSRDIEVFLRAEFARIRRDKPDACLPLPNGEEWPGNVIIVLIRDDSDSQFMYPRLCIDYIDNSFFSPDRQLRTLLAARPARAFSKLDTLYHLILSRRSPDLLEEGDEALRQYQELIMGILQIIIAWPGGPFSVTQIADILHEKVDDVQNIIHGPMRSLFKFQAGDRHSHITLCHKSLRDCLLSRDRSREFFIPAGDADTLFAALLSRRPPSNSSRPYSREVLMGVLTLVATLSGELNVAQIASWLDVVPSLVEHVIFDGPAKAIFTKSLYDGSCIIFSTSSFKEFLLDASRAGQYFIPGDKPLDTLFNKVLSRQPPSDPSQSYSREVLMGVLKTLIAPKGWMEIPRIACALDIAPSLVECVVFGPAKVLFKVHHAKNMICLFNSSFRRFLLDAERAGEFFISEDKINSFFIQILSQPLQTCSREVLMAVLRECMIRRGSWLNVRRIASSLAVDSAAVEAILGLAVFMSYEEDDGDVYLLPAAIDFLQDVNRAGSFYIPPKNLHTDYDYMYNHVRKR